VTHQTTDVVRLGSAGCLDHNRDGCGYLGHGEDGYSCSRHRVVLTEHSSGGQPVRAAVCADEAEKTAWSRIMKARQ